MAGQASLFEVDGYSVDEQRVSLGAAGYTKTEVALPYKAKVRIFAEGYVGKVNFLRQPGGKTVRQHVIIVDVDSLEYELTGTAIADDEEAKAGAGDSDDQEADEADKVDPELEKELAGVFA